MFKKKDLTNVPVFQALIQLSIPLVLINVILTLYQVVDMFWVAKLGTESIAAISVSFPIIFVINSIMFGVSSSGAIIVAQYFGKKEHDKIDYYAGQTLIWLTIIGLATGILGYLLSDLLITLIGAESNVSILASGYTKIIFIGIVFGFVYQGFTSILRSLGQVKLPLLIAFIGLLLNFILDPLFIFGWNVIPKMGVNGSAIATVLTQGFSLLIALIWLKLHKELVNIRKKDLYPNKKALFEFIKIGFPTTLEFLSRSIGFVLLTFIIAWFGTNALAAYGVGMRVTSLAMIPSFGISLATLTLIGQTLGAKKIEKIHEIVKKGMLFSFTFLTILEVIILVFVKDLTSFFIENDLTVLNEAITSVVMFVLLFGFFGANVVILSAYRGAGKTTIAMALSFANIFVQLIIALILIFVFNLDLFGVWLSYPITTIIIFIISYGYYKTHPIEKSIV
ncbi:MAG TPA: MATE family efflux transporter [archaeon]|nr:MATE family efflux transporter [archaeon]